MAILFAAGESTVLIDGQVVEGVRAIEYRFQQVRTSVFALISPPNAFATTA
jgi:hypothetical protein